MSYSCKVVADSINNFGNRITTFLVTFPRFILAEFNTHRMFSRNSASSRAIPFKKMVQSVKENPFIPLRWMKDHPGMQGMEYFSDNDVRGRDPYQTVVGYFNNIWLSARDQAVSNAELLYDGYGANVSKQICNRLLEPFMWHTCIVTATEWENFFALRAHEAAEIHMQKLAYIMLEEYNASTPKLLSPDEWHIPFSDQIDTSWFRINSSEMDPNIASAKNAAYNDPMVLQKISTAMSARTSYTVVGGAEKKTDYLADIKLHDRLLEQGHLSPFEHCAKAMNRIESLSGYGTASGNFIGFIQYRKLFNNENKRDGRVLVKS